MSTTTTKPIPTATSAPSVVKPQPNKTQPINPTRHHPYRENLPTRRRVKPPPPPPPSSTSRRRCCLAFLWSILIITLILAAITTAFYVAYDPHYPAFTITALKITSFNLTTVSSDDSTSLATNLNLTLTAKNPNKKITFIFEHVYINVRSSSVSLANDDYNSFTSLANDVFVIHTVMGHGSRVMNDPDELNALKNDLKNKNGLPVNVVVDSKVGIKLEKRKMVKKVGFRVTCDDVRGKVPGAANGKSVVPAVADVSKAKCKVGLKVKIFGWAFFL